MTKLYIEGRRDGYTPSQCRRTLTVGELREYLEQFEDDIKIYLINDNGYTYGSIDYDSFSDDSDEQEEVDENLKEEKSKSKDIFSMIMRDIDKMKAKLRNEKPYENFGQKEVRELRDKYSDYRYGEYSDAYEQIDEFDKWCQTYTGNKDSMKNMYYEENHYKDELIEDINDNKTIILTKIDDNIYTVPEEEYELYKKYNVMNAGWTNWTENGFDTFEDVIEYCNKYYKFNSYKLKLVEDLIQSDSEEAFKKNVETEIKAGKPKDQALAIAYSVKEKNMKESLYQVQVNGEDMGTFDNEADAYREKSSIEMQGKKAEVVEIEGDFDEDDIDEERDYEFIQETAKYIFNLIIDDCLGRKEIEIKDELIPTYDNILEEWDDRVTKKQYDESVRIIKSFNGFEIYKADRDTYLQLSDNHTLFDIDNELLDLEYYGVIVSDALESFEERTGVNVYTEGRSGRHIVVDLTYENCYHYDELKDIQKSLEQQVIDAANSFKGFEDEEEFDESWGTKATRVNTISKDNIEECLNKIDSNTNNRYDLLNTYYMSSLSEEKENQLLEALTSNKSALNLYNILKEDCE